MKYKKPARLANIAIDADAAVISSFGDQHGIYPFEAIHADAIDWLASSKTVISGDTLIYCDPPYLMSTRRIQDRPIYRYELCDADHARLLDVLLGLRCMVMISGYPSDLYDQALQSWRRVSFYAMTRGGKMAEEIVWLNFPEPFELHDYQFLGKNFRERERIKRKIQRWKAKLIKMDAVERAALMSALEQVRPGPALPARLASNAGFGDGSRNSADFEARSGIALPGGIDDRDDTCRYASSFLGVAARAGIGN